MKTFTYTHHQGGEGKLTEKATMEEPFKGDYDTVQKWEDDWENDNDAYKEHIASLITYPTQGHVPWSNGQEVREDEFVLTEEFDTPMVTAPGLVHNGVRRIIAVPVKERGFTINTAVPIAIENLSDYSLNDAIGSDHWFNTLMSQVLHIGEYMKTHPDRKLEHQKDWGEKLYNIAKDMFEQKRTNSIAIEKREERTQDELWGGFGKIMDEIFCDGGFAYARTRIESIITTLKREGYLITKTK